MDLQVHVDGQVVTSGRYLLAVVSNIHLYAGGFSEISPTARLDDGRMDLWLFAGETLLETLQHAWNLWSGQHLTSDQVCCMPFRYATIHSNNPMYVQVDGEPLELEGEVRIEVQRKRLAVLMPPNAPRKLFVREQPV